MSIYMEYENSLDRDYDILMRRFDIAMERAEATYKYESLLADNLDLGYMVETTDNSNDNEGELKPSKVAKVKNAFSNFIKKIVTYMKNLIEDVCELFSNMFKKGDHIDYEAYIKSDTGQERFDFDCVDVSIKAADEVRKGRKIIQAISRATHIDDATVEEYVDKASRTIIDNKEMVIAVPLAYVLYKKGSGKTKEMAKDIDEAGKEAEKVTDPEKQKAIRKVFGAMQKKVKVGTDAVRQYGSKLSNRVSKNKKSKDTSKNEESKSEE